MHDHLITLCGLAIISAGCAAGSYEWPLIQTTYVGLTAFWSYFVLKEAHFLLRMLRDNKDTDS